MKLLFIVISVMAVDLEFTIKQMRETEFGRSFLEKVPLTDPVEKIIRDIANFYNTVDRKLEEGV